MSDLKLSRSNPADHIKAWVSGYASDNRKNKPLAFLQAYIDDSYDNTGERRLFLAGYLHNAEAWECFSNAWEFALREVPSIEYFKMSEANALRGQFFGWSDESRDLKIVKLLAIIKTFNPVSFHISLSRTSFDEHIAPVAPYALANPHFHCIGGIVALASNYVESRNIKTGIDFIFDKQEGVQFDIALFFDDLMKRLPTSQKALISKTPVFADDKEFLPLQAADLLAWHLRKEGNPEPSTNGRLKYLLGDEHFHTEIDETRIKSIGKGFALYTKDQRLQNKNDWKKMKKQIPVMLKGGYIPPMGTRWKNFLFYCREFNQRHTK